MRYKAEVISARLLGTDMVSCVRNTETNLLISAPFTTFDEDLAWDYARWSAQVSNEKGEVYFPKRFNGWEKELL